MVIASSSIEEAVHEIESAAKRETIEKTAMSKAELWLKIIVGLSLFGMTLANPGFVEIVKSFSR